MVSNNEGRDLCLFCSQGMTIGAKATSEHRSCKNKELVEQIWQIIGGDVCISRNQKRCMYKFLIAAVTDYHKLSDLIKMIHTYLGVQLFRSIKWVSDKNQGAVAGLHSFWRLSGRFIFFASTPSSFFFYLPGNHIP